MRQIFKPFTFLLLLGFFSSVGAGEFTGCSVVLTENDFDVRNLKSTGHVIVEGNLDKAGEKVTLDEVKIIVLAEEVIELKDADSIKLKKVAAPLILHNESSLALAKRVKASDIKFVQVNGQRVSSKQIKGFVYKSAQQ